MSSSSSSDRNVVEVKAVPIEIETESSGEVPPMSEWSSLVIEVPEENRKKALYARSLYSPGSGEICAKYIEMSDSDVFRHHYYNYPAVLDPGIKEALLSPEKPTIFSDNGQDLYKALCEESNTPMVKIFYNGLITDEINLNYYGVDPNTVRQMALALQYNKTVVNLNIKDNFLNDDACYHLSQIIATNTTIKKINLEGCRIGSSGILRLASTLIANQSLVELNLSRNELEEQGGKYFATQIGNGAGLEKVNLSNNKLGQLTAMALAEALEYHNKLTHLDLSWNNFYHIPSATKMLEHLSYSEVLQELNLSWNSLEGEKIADMIKYVIFVPTLKKLNLSNNRFKDEAITIIAEGLLKSKKLSVLNLSFNPLSTKDANVLLARMLKPRAKLDTLLLEGVPVDKKYPALIERVKTIKSRKNFTIKHGRVLGNWTVQGPDARKLALERANYLGVNQKKRSFDVALFFLSISKEYPKPIPVKTLIDRLNMEKSPLDEDLIVEIAVLFPGTAAKTKTIDIQAICDYIHRIWPDKQLPPTPPSEPDPELLIPPPSHKMKAKRK